jgi:hypothetical protein
LPFSLQEHLYFFTRLNVSENAAAKGVASTAPLVKVSPSKCKRFGDPQVTSHEEILKTLAAEEAFLTLSRPVHADFSIWTFKHWRFFFEIGLV